ncbi:BMC domain-containing protein [Klebsiella pneumoniae]|uniref:BMC domain-containing protein n=1 Tax=Klebsiella pneumoniae TaxID=573 RepID=UPI0020A741AA|nr:BMC domain-containing protein [Klebsiella pneumoniae]MCP3210454.1 BMC domain-containing protein [Klebsiella pneumoniae]
MDKERIIQEFVPGKQVTLAHLIAHPGAELAKKVGVPESGAIGIMTLTPGETAMIAGDLAMIAGDLAMKAADVHIGFLDRFSGALVIYGSVGAVEEALLQTIGGLGRLLNYTLCELTKS